MTVITDVPQEGPIDQPSGSGKRLITPPWMAWFKQVFLCAFSVQDSGTTAQRPTSKLWIGRRYFDTTLDQPVWYDGTTWVTWPAPGSSFPSAIAATSRWIYSVWLKGTAGPNMVGISVVPVGPGLSDPVINLTASKSRSMMRQYVTTSGGGAAPYGFQEQNTQYSFMRRGGATYGTGFTFSLMAGTENSGAFNGTCQWLSGFCDITGGNSFSLTGNPSTSTDGVFVGADSTDTNMQLFIGGGGVWSKTDLGFNKTLADQCWLLQVNCPVGVDSLTATVTYWAPGSFTPVSAANVTKTTGLPGNSVQLACRNLVRDSITGPSIWQSYVQYSEVNV